MRPAAAYLYHARRYRRGGSYELYRLARAAAYQAAYRSRSASRSCILASIRDAVSNYATPMGETITRLTSMLIRKSKAVDRAMYY